MTSGVRKIYMTGDIVRDYDRSTRQSDNEQGGGK